MTELNNSDLPKSGSEVIDSKGFMTRAWYTYFRKLPGSIQALLASVEGLVVDIANLVPNTRRVDTTAPLAGGGELTADLTITTLMATDRLIGRDTAGSGVMEEITVGGGIEFTGSGGVQRSALTGDVTASAGSNSTTIANAAVTYAKMQDVSAASKLLGRGDSGSGDVQEITLGSNLTMTGTTLAASGGGAFTFVNTATVSGSPATTLSMSGLDLSADKCYFIRFSFRNVTASSITISMYYNADTTSTNYRRQALEGYGGSAGAANANDAALAGLPAVGAGSAAIDGWGWIQLDREGYAKSWLTYNYYSNSANGNRSTAHIYLTATNVTGITFSSSVASAFGVGDFFKIWKMAD